MINYFRFPYLFFNFLDGFSTEEETQVSYDVMNLYLSIPIDKAITFLIDTLNIDLDDLSTCTKLTITDIHKLTKFCLSKFL